MSLSVNDLAELVEMWEELNFTTTNNNNPQPPHRHLGNLTHALELCPARFSQGALFSSLAVVYLLVFLVGLAANGLVVWLGVAGGSARLPQGHLYVVNLAVADLCVAATLPAWAGSLLQRGHWPFGGAACRAAHLLFSVNLFSSIFFITCMSVDRCLSARSYGAGVDSRRKQLIRRAVCVCVWAAALLASLPDTYYLRVVPSSHGDGTLVCRSVYPGPDPRGWMLGVQLGFMALGFLLPFPVLAASYLLLARRLLKEERDRRDWEPREREERRVGRRLLLSYTVVFLLCWLPYHASLLLDTLALLNALPFSCAAENFLFLSLHLTQCLSLLHCCLNPVLYTFLSRGRRHHLLKALLLRCSSRPSLGPGHASSLVSQETEYEEVESHTPL